MLSSRIAYYYSRYYVRYFKIRVSYSNSSVPLFIMPAYVFIYSRLRGGFGSPSHDPTPIARNHRRYGPTSAGQIDVTIREPSARCLYFRSKKFEFATTIRPRWRGLPLSGNVNSSAVRRERVLIVDLRFMEEVAEALRPRTVQH